MEPNDDFLKHIKDTLRDYEEPYEDGAWERFAGKNIPVKHKPVIALWKLIAAAAAIVAGIFLFSKIYFNNHIPNPSTDIVKSNISNKPGTDSNTSDMAIIPEVKPGDSIPINNTGNNVIAQLNDSTSISNTSQLFTTIQPMHNGEIPVIIPQQKLSPDTINKPTISTAQESQTQKKEAPDFWKNKIVEEPQPDKDVLQQKNYPSTANVQPSLDKPVSKERNKKWQPGLYVSPIFGDMGVNMGYGFTMGYAINDKIKISSGIAHAKVSASRSYNNSQPIIDASPVSTTVAKPMLMAASISIPQETSTLQNVNGYLSGIDIPVEISYNFTKKLYATAGVSGLVVINDKKNYDLVTSQNVKISVETNQGVVKEDKSVTLNYATAASSNATVSNENTPFLGFYNLSVGYKQKISKNNAISLEPFIKIPMKNISQQNLNYSGTGIRLKLDF